MHAHIHVHAHVHTHIRTHVRAHVHAHVHARVHAHTTPYTSLQASLYAVYTNVHTNVSAQVHFNAYDTDGTKHGFCGLAWQDHYQCCRDVQPHETSSYAYVDTLVAHNVRRACHNTTAAALDAAIADPPAACASLLAMIEGRRATQPLTRWDDSMTGRHSAWPPIAMPPAYV